MRNIETLVDIFYKLYGEKHIAVEEPEDYEKHMKDLLKSLDKKQSALFHKYDLDDFDVQIAREKSIIQFMLELLCLDYE